MRRVIVHIDSLVLKGFRPEDRHAIAQGLQEQLTNMLSASADAQQIEHTQSISRLRVGNINIAADASPRHIGVAIANKVGKGFVP